MATTQNSSAIDNFNITKWCNDLINIDTMFKITYHYLAFTLGIIGTIGNSACLVIFCSNEFIRKHFTPYRALAIIELMFSINLLVIQLGALSFCSATPKSVAVSDVFWKSIMYTYVIGWMTSGLQYSAIYITILLTLERFLAMCFPFFHRRHITHISTMAIRSSILVSIITAFTINSWSAFYQFQITTKVVNGSSGYEPSYWSIQTNVTSTIKMWLNVTNIYNSITRISTFMALSIMVVAIFVSNKRHYKQLETLKKESKKKEIEKIDVEGESQKQNVNLLNQATPNEPKETKKTINGNELVALTLVPFKRVKRQQQHKHLINLLLVVLIFELACGSIRESRRIFGFFESSLVNRSESALIAKDIESYKRYDLLLFCGHLLLYIGALANALTRSLKFFLFFKCSQNFSKQVIATCKCEYNNV